MRESGQAQVFVIIAAERNSNGETFGNLSIALENGKRGAQLVSFHNQERNIWKQMLRELKEDQSEGKPSQLHGRN
ncbi:MAG TPA: hypothetical protein DEP53_14780 [Bacteroidetes bacterium]|nr:hypothetical protein [Bacteroidota bacterium]